MIMLLLTYRAHMHDASQQAAMLTRPLAHSLAVRTGLLLMYSCLICMPALTRHAGIQATIHDSRQIQDSTPGCQPPSASQAKQMHSTPRPAQAALPDPQPAQDCSCGARRWCRC